MSDQVSTNKPATGLPVPPAALTPDMQAFINASIQAAVSGVFTQIAPVLQSIALTPEKLQAAMKPYEDPAKVARELRERQQMKEQDAEARRNTALRQKNCPHQDKNGNWAIDLVHNFPDHQPRGVCPLCHVWIHPQEWRIEAPDAANPKGHAKIVPEHPLYQVVRLLEAQGL